MDSEAVDTARSRIARRSSSKGGAWERFLAREIGKWWCGDTESFWRTRGSGAHSRRTGIHFGDIAPVKMAPHEAPITVEAKHVKAWSLPQLLVGAERCSVLRFWDQLQTELRPGSFGFLVVRGHRTPIYAMAKVHDLGTISFPVGAVPHLSLPSSGRLVLMPFADFLANASPANITKAFGLNHPDWQA